MKKPGYITVDKQMHYADNPDLMNQFVQQITSWASSVPVGTSAALADVMNFNGPPYGMPVETWTDPFDAGMIDGVELLVPYGPLEPVAFGMPKMVHKFA